MSRAIQRRLKQERNALVEKLAQNIGPATHRKTDATLARIAKIDKIDKILAVVGGDPWTEKLLRLGVTAFCVVAIWAAWTVRVDTFGVQTPFTATFETDAASLSIRTPEGASNADGAAAWGLTEPMTLAAGDAVIEAAALSLSDPSLAPYTGETVRRAVLRATDLTLAALDVTDGSEMRLAVRPPGRLEIAVPRGSFAAKLQFGGEGELSWRDAEGPGARSFDLFVPEVLDASAKLDGPGQSARVLVPLAQTSVLTDLAVRDLSFAVLKPGAAGASEVFRSALRKGSLQLPQTDETATLHLGYSVAFSGLDATVRELVIHPDRPMELSVVGTFERLRIEQQGFARDLTPSLLVFVMKNQPLFFFIGAVTSLSGLLWGMRRWF